MKWLLLAGGLFLLVGCAVSLPNEMSWKDYYISRHALHVTYSRADVFECEELGSVSGRSYDDITTAKEKAISEAVLLGADHLLFDEVGTDFDERRAYMPLGGSTVYVYGTAYKCGGCVECVRGGGPRTTRDDW